MNSVDDEKYFWDLALPKLLFLFNEVWGNEIQGASHRQSIASLFAMRALRRLLAVNQLFKKGFYLESHCLVRAGYEDWLQLAYLLRQSGENRCLAFIERIYKLDARIYDAFSKLCGKTTADKYFVKLPNSVASYTGKKRSETQPEKFSSLAEDVGLQDVHNFVYSYLSGFSHPDGRCNYIFDDSKPISRSRIPHRDASDETRLAIWFLWFTCRIEVLASREFDFNHESFSEEYLLPLADDKQMNLENCVLVREYCDLDRINP